jgi:hypothetical protein
MKTSAILTIGLLCVWCSLCVDDKDKNDQRMLGYALGFGLLFILVCKNLYSKDKECSTYEYVVNNEAANQEIEAANQEIEAADQEIEAADQEIEAADQEIEAANQEIEEANEDNVDNQNLSKNNGESQSPIEEPEKSDDILQFLINILPTLGKMIGTYFSIGLICGLMAYLRKNDKRDFWRYFFGWFCYCILEMCGGGDPVCIGYILQCCGECGDECCQVLF